MRQVAMAMSVLMVTIGSGCSPTSVGKAAFKIVRGAQADATCVEPLTRETLVPYQRIKLGEITTDLTPICPDEVLRAVRMEAAEVLAEDKTREVFPGGGKTLKFDVLVRFCKKKSVLGGGRLDWLVSLRDGASGDPVSSIFVEGVTESPIQHGVDEMAKENTKELIKFLGKIKEGEEDEGDEAEKRDEDEGHRENAEQDVDSHEQTGQDEDHAEQDEGDDKDEEKEG